MAAPPSSPDLGMPSFRLLSDSDEEGGRPKRKLADSEFSPENDVRKSFKKWIASKFADSDEHVLPSDSSDTDPSWNFRKKYLGGDDLPDGIEWSSDLERFEGESEDDSITTDDIREMRSDTDIFFAEPTESPSKLQRFRQRVLKAKGTSKIGGKGTSEESTSEAESSVGVKSASINGKEEKVQDNLGWMKSI